MSLRSVDPRQLSGPTASVHDHPKDRAPASCLQLPLSKTVLGPIRGSTLRKKATAEHAKRASLPDGRGVERTRKTVRLNYTQRDAF